MFIEKIAAEFNEQIVLESPVSEIYRNEDGVELKVNGHVHRFDYLILAVPPQITLQVVKDLSEDEKDVIQSFKTSITKVYFHSDESWLPEKEQWSILNLMEDDRGNYCTFWAGGVHPDKPPFFLSWGDQLKEVPDPEKTFQTVFQSTSQSIDEG